MLRMDHDAYQFSGSGCKGLADDETPEIRPVSFRVAVSKLRHRLSIGAKTDIGSAVAS
jgi:hypothetical protein